jgi:hypothetical protein
MYSNTAHIYQQSKLPGMDLFLLDIMLQKLGMSCITTCFVDTFLGVCPFSFGHCVVCPLIDGF